MIQRVRNPIDDQMYNRRTTVASRAEHARISAVGQTAVLTSPTTSAFCAISPHPNPAIGSNPLSPCTVRTVSIMFDQPTVVRA